MSRFAPREQLQAMSGYHSPQVDVPIRLNTNESPFPPPDGWVESLATIARAIDWNRYPDRMVTDLRHTIAQRHGVGAENVFVANGSNEVLQTLFLTYAGTGRTIATFEPTYQMYAQIARVTGAEVVSGERRSDFTLDQNEIERVVARSSPALTVLCNPNNPTGIVEPRQNLEQLLDVAPGVVVVDEAYAEFADWSAIGDVSEDRNLVVTRTFSKTLSLAALRVGYAIAPSWMVEEMNLAVLPYHLDSFKQAATQAALLYTDEMEARVEVIKSERSRIQSAFGTWGVQFWQSGANFILFRVSDAAGVWSGLLEHGILVRDCSSWRGLEGCLRVTVGTPEENAAFLDAMAKVLTGP